jgi:DNA replication protein DnaC
LRHQAAVEVIDYRTARGLDRALFQKLIGRAWIGARDNVIICGPTGVGKSWLACALGHKACRDIRSVSLPARSQAVRRSDTGPRRRPLRSPPWALFGVQLLILDDFALELIDAQARHELLEIAEERYGRRSTLITSQLPVETMARHYR